MTLMTEHDLGKQHKDIFSFAIKDDFLKTCCVNLTFMTVYNLVMMTQGQERGNRKLLKHCDWKGAVPMEKGKHTSRKRHLSKVRR